MADWELLVPGIGLTVLGMAGVGISLAGIARTFMEGMHSISAFVMFIGLIFLAAGIFKDGIPRGNQAKAAALVIVGFMATFGAFAVGISGISALVTYIGVLFLILVPAVVIAWAAHKKSPNFKAISILFSSASVVGIIAFFSFGLVAPQPIEAGVIEMEPEPEITGPTFAVSVLEGSSIEGNPAYEPEEFTVPKGTTIMWTNNDSVVHTVTSGTIEMPDFGELFDSGIMSANEIYTLNTSDLEIGEYVYFCTLHPYMIGKFTVIEDESLMEERVDVVEVDMVLGSANVNNPEFYVPEEVTVEKGTTVVWINSDTTGHTVTSGLPGDADAGALFDSGFPLMTPDAKFEVTFTEEGEYPYFCLVHPWMIGKVIVI